MRIWAVAWWDFLASPFASPNDVCLVMGVDEAQAIANARVQMNVKDPTALWRTRELLS